MTHGRGDPWTTEQDWNLARLWESGLTARNIAERLGRTRNSIIGRVHRLKLTPRGSPIRGAAQRPKSDVKPPRVKLTLPARVVIAAKQAAYLSRQPKPPPAPLMALPISARHACQWIAGEPSADDACKCGAPAVAGWSWCPEHLARVYVFAKRAEQPEAEAA